MYEEDLDREGELVHLYALSKIKGIGEITLARLLLKYGSAKAIYKLDFEVSSKAQIELKELIRMGKSDKLLAEGDEMLSRLISIDAHAISILDDGYPLSLSQLPSAPPILYIQGELTEDDNYAIAIVGTRKATAKGKKAAHWLAEQVAKNGITVLSGLALGIDTAAHSGALTALGKTIAVVGTGLDIVYPPENTSLLESILRSGGAVVSQFPPGTKIQPWQFPMRNRVMSGMAQGTVVVEAGPSSGAKIQAQYAAEQGRVVFLMKQQVEKYKWARELVSEGQAVVVETVDDVLPHVLTPEELGHLPETFDFEDILI